MATPETAVELLREADRIMRGQLDPVVWLAEYDAYLRAHDAASVQPDAQVEGRWRVEEYGWFGESDLWTDGTQTIEVPKSLTRIIESALASQAPATDALREALDVLRAFHRVAHGCEPEDCEVVPACKAKYVIARAALGQQQQARDA